MMTANYPSNNSIEPRNYQNVYQFRITLMDIKPNIWRRILVPENYNFRDLHLAINSSMGWLNYHLHQFDIKNPVTGEKEVIGREEDGVDDFFLTTVDEKTKKISDYFVIPNYKAKYTYDFGDGWEHEVVFQKKIAADVNTEYPKCVAGKRACPPEDCGGSWGYQEILQVLSDPSNPEYEDRKSNLGIVDFDPDKFDPNEVHFINFEF